MRILFFYLLTNIIVMSSFSQSSLVTPFEKNENQTTTYQECIAYYLMLAGQFKEISCTPVLETDSGFPLHEVVISLDAKTPEEARKKGKTILFLNNGIHPGEPEGIDASMMLARDLVTKPAMRKLLEHTTVVIVPVYNIDGCLNRNSHSRANQNGPEAYGFRGNDRNLDLNRDFIKCDTRNAKSFNALFTKWMPDVMIDNHTSNGADYQYVMTLITSQEDKLGPAMAQYVKKELNPALFKGMNNKGWDMVPYVNADGPPDEDGIEQFLDLPRFSSGYAALHHCIAFMPETHMLKAFPPRVRSTYDMMLVMLEYLESHGDKVQKIKQDNINWYKQQKTIPINWTLDKLQFDTIPFKGFEAAHKTSEVTGHDRLYYDRNKPFTKTIPYYNTYKSSQEVSKPYAYIISQAYDNVIDRLIRNKVHVERLAADTNINVQIYRIKDYKTNATAYEGHFLHNHTTVETIKTQKTFRKGDYLVYCDQDAIRYVVETLEPEAPDSFFNWNFFDGILGQKEYFSDYVFEDLAAQYLKDNPTIKAELDKKKAADEAFRNSSKDILDWVYHHSPWYEPTHKIYPVARLMEPMDLPTIR